MEKWKYKYLLFILICSIIIGYPFFTIKYFESQTALKIAAKYLLLPILIILLIIGPKFYIKNDFIYFCASVDRFGYHEFAVTQAEHEQNAKKYYNWINSQGVKR